MCFNSTISILTWVIGMLGSFRLYYLRYYPEAIFYIWVIQMQLIEYFLWKSNEMSNGVCLNENISASKLGIIINHTEPIVFWLAMLYFGYTLKYEINIIMIFFIIFTIFYTKNVLLDECTVISEKSKPHLHWKWNSGDYSIYYYIIFISVLVMLSLFGLRSNRGKIHSLVILISYFTSYIIYGDKHSTGSMWCFMAAFIPIILPSLYIYI